VFGFVPLWSDLSFEIVLSSSVLGRFCGFSTEFGVILLNYGLFMAIHGLNGFCGGAGGKTAEQG